MDVCNQPCSFGYLSDVAKAFSIGHSLQSVPFILPFQLFFWGSIEICFIPLPMRGKQNLLVYFGGKLFNLPRENLMQTS